jgi:ABC-type Fe3+-hydroxamate transport system substrate-binding protein
MRRRVILLTLGVILALAAGLTLALAGGGATPDSGGERAGPPGKPSGIVVLSPALCETLRALGPGEPIIGRHAFDRGTDPSVPIVGDQRGIEYETLARLRPGAVVLEASAAATPARLKNLADELAFAIHRVPTLTLEDVRASIGVIGAIAGRPPRRIAELERAFDAARRPIDDERTREALQRVLLLAGTDPPGALGPGSYHHELIEAMGGSSALIDGGPFQRLSAEDVAALSPGAVVLLAPGLRDEPVVTGADATRELGVLGDVGLPAVREGRAAVLSGGAVLLPSAPGVMALAADLRTTATAFAGEPTPAAAEPGR